MKLYVVYFRTMVNSPEVTIKCATISKFIAEQALTKAQREADEWMAADTSVDDRTEFSYKDPKMRNLEWSGEVSAINVYGCRNGMAGLFAWWEE